MIFLFENTIIKENASRIISYINNNEYSFGELGKDYWKGRTIYLSQIRDDSVKKILKEHKNELLNKFNEHYKDSKPIYIDSLHIVRWPVGYELKPHADGENPDGTQHEYYWRNFGTATFLNEDFEGGDLYFPNKDVIIKPKIAYTAIFPGTLEYLHGVTKITKGVRYTLASFLTYDKNKEFKI